MDSFWPSSTIASIWSFCSSKLRTISTVIVSNSIISPRRVLRKNRTELIHLTIVFYSLTMASSNLPLLFTIGDIIEIDSKEKAYILYISGETHDLFFKVSYIIGGNEERNISQKRCRVVPISEPTMSSRGLRTMA